MISVIVPAYNAAARLGNCLTALQQQTCPPTEIIVVDDGSEDNTIAVAQRRGAQVITQDHRGAPSARNMGTQQACGDIILFTDADCEPAPDWIAEMVQPFSDPDVAGVKGAYSTRQREIVARLAQCEVEERYDRLEQFSTIDFVDGYSAAFRASALRHVGGFAPVFLGDEDGDLSYRLVRRGFKLKFNRRAKVYHWHPTTWGDYWRRKIWRGYWRTVVFRFHLRKTLHDTHTPQLLKVHILLVYLGIALIVAVLFSPALVWLLAVWCIVSFLSAIPFALKVFQVDRPLAIWAWIFIAVRATAFAIGAVGALIGMLFFRDPAVVIRRLGEILWKGK